MEAVIWKGGKPQPNELCDHDGVIISEIINGIEKSIGGRIAREFW